MRGLKQALIVVAAISGAIFPTIAEARPGALDRGFSGDGRATAFFRHWQLSNVVVDLAVGDDGKAVIATEMLHNRNFRSEPGIVRFTRRGKPDRSFAANGRAIAETPGEDFDVQVAVQADGKILIANNSARARVIRLTRSGALDRSFVDGGEDVLPQLARISALEVQPDGAIVVAGAIWTEDGSTGARPNLDFAAVRLNATGALDTSFGNGGLATVDFRSPEESGLESTDTATSVAIREDGEIILCGTSEVYGESTYRNGVGVAALQPDGTLDPGFGDGGLFLAGPESGTASVRRGPGGGAAVALDVDGRVVFAGIARGDFTASRLTPTGLPDSSFTGDGTAVVDGGSKHDLADAVAVSPRGWVSLAGSVGGRSTADFAVLQLSRSGSRAPEFGRDGIRTVDFNGAYDDADGIHALANGKLLVSGTVGTRRLGLIRLQGP